MMYGIKLLYHTSITSPTHLRRLANVLDRAGISMTSPDEVIHRRKDDNNAITKHSPVHRLNRRVRPRRPKRKDPKHPQENQRNDINRQAGPSQIELGRQQRLATDALERHARDGDDVRGDHGGGTERDDLHVRDAGAELDEGEDGDEGDGDVDCIYGDFEARRDSAEDGGEGEAFVAGEGEELARVGGHDGDAGEDADGEHHDGQDGCAGRGAGCVEEDLHEADYLELAMRLVRRVKRWCIPPRGVVRTDMVSVTQKQKVMAMIQPKRPLPTQVHIMARGMT